MYKTIIQVLKFRQWKKLCITIRSPIERPFTFHLYCLQIYKTNIEKKRCLEIIMTKAELLWLILPLTILE